jgi:hypothetical protein
MAGDLSSVSRNKFFEPGRAMQAWGVLFDQHVEAHGLPEAYVEYLAKMTKALALYEKAYNGKRWQIVKARVLESEAEKLLQGEGEKIETTCARISKFIGFPVRANECNVVEFYNYVAIMASN